VKGSRLPRSEHRPLRIEPEDGQAPQNVSKSERSDTWNVFQEDVAGSSQANCSLDGRPQPPVVVLPCSPAGDADGLAGEPGCDEVARLGLDGPCVVVDGGVREPLLEDPSTPRVDFADLHGSHSGPFEAEVDEADA